MLRIVMLLSGCALALVLSAGPAGALSEKTEAAHWPETGCESAKLRAAAHYFGCLTRAHEEANAQSEALSGDAVARCDERFGRAFEKAEARGFCRTPGGASTLREPIKAQVQTLADNLAAETGCSNLTIITGEIATCTVNKTASTIDLATVVDQLSQSGVTDETTLWIEAWGGNGSNGNVCCVWGGRGGQGGYAQTTTSLSAFANAYGTTELYYYLGTNGTFARDAGGDGGTVTLATVNDLTQTDVDLADTLLIAGGGGGGGAGRGASECGLETRIRGGAGGDGAPAIHLGGPQDFTIVVGANGGSRESPRTIRETDNSGQGGQVATGGSNNGGSSEPGDGPAAPLGGRGGNHLSPQIGFVNAPGTTLTGGGGRGSDGGNLAGGGGGGGGYTGGGGGNRGVWITDCVSGGGGGGSSFVRQVPDSPTCSAAPTMRPDNPNGIEGFVQITFDLGACDD